MPFDRFMIAPLQGGLQTDVRPWMIPDDAFARLDNAYVFRGRVRKRFGSELLQGSTPTPGFEQLQSRLRINLGAGAAGVVPGVPPNAIGEAFSIGNEFFTVFQAAGVMLSTGATVGTFNIATGAYTFAPAPGANVYYYPSSPVMGLATLEQSNLNDETLIAFDTQFAYEYTATGFERLAAGASVWTGNNAQFFWTTNYRGTNEFENVLYVTNFNQNEPMRYFFAGVWTNFTPAITAAINLNSARILVPFKNRLIAFNTWEGAAFPGDHFPQRARYSQIGSPLDVNAWREDIPGRGNAVDAPTSEAIVTVEFIKDRLIVYFERSTWELVYTGNQAFPFNWQQINTELGAESTFSIIPFDKVAIGVGNVGIHACNGSNVQRIDEKIPNTVFEFHNQNNGVERVYGIRDYYVEMIYWSVPDLTRSAEFPFNNRVLIFNYQTGTWAFNDDSITAFGYFQQQESGTSTTWAELNTTWEETVLTWGSAPLQGKFRNVIAGNQEGYVFIVLPDVSRNAPVLQITNILAVGAHTQLTIINHNLSEGDFILIENALGTTTFNNTIVKVELVIDANTIDIGVNPFVGVYTGAGTATRVSVINMYTKEYNFYVNKGRNAYFYKTDFLVDKTANGQLTIDFFVSSADLSMINAGLATGSLVGTNVLETSPYVLVPLEQQQERLWHPVYLQAEGECIQLHMYMTDDQMEDPDISLSDFELHAMTFYAQPTSSRLQ